MKKLTKLSENFYKMGLTRAEKADFKMLDTLAEDFFPKMNTVQEYLKTFCDNDIRKIFKLRVEKNKDYNMDNLFLLTQNEQWLAGYFQFYVMDNLAKSFYQVDASKEADNSTMASIKKYVEISPKFKAKRSEFEQNIVKAYIQNWTSNDWGDDFSCKQEKKWALSFSPNFDKEFRNKVSVAMQLLNVKPEAVEAGIEGLAGFWREEAMKLAFQNNFRKNFDKEFNYDTADKSEIEYAHQWLALRELEYFKDHKAAVKKYGSQTEAMKMSGKAANKMRRVVEAWENKRAIDTWSRRLEMNDLESTKY